MGLPKGQKKPLPHLKRRGADPVFGVRKPLPTKTLPLVREVGQALAYEAEEERFRRGVKDIDCDHASTVVASQLKELYTKASIPTVDTPREGRQGGRVESKQR